MKERLYTADSEQREQISRRLADILGSCEGVLFAFVYGSFAGDEPFHDIDVAVYLSDALEADAALNALGLSDRLSIDIGMPVDVRPLNSASVPFRYQVIRGRLLFEKDEDLTVRFIEQTVRRYLDMKPFLLAGMKEAFSA